MKFTGYLPSISLLLVSCMSAEKIHDFDVACQIFTEAHNTTFNNREERSAYVEDNIEVRVQSKTVKASYYVVFNLPPEQRYDVFKKAAEHKLNRTWDCPAAKALFR